MISPAEYETIVADITALRPQAQPGTFDVVVIGNTSGTLPTTDSLPAYAAAGVTWMLSQALSVDEARRRLRGGPRRCPPESPRPHAPEALSVLSSVLRVLSGV